jgi:uncharacterized protein YjiS (DUF1127 family)
MHGLVGRWADWAASRPRILAQGFGQWRNERAMISALGALDDGALKDIGLSRGEIPGLARQRWRSAGVS